MALATNWSGTPGLDIDEARLQTWSNLVIAAGSLYRNMVLPYKRFPHCLASLADPACSLAAKVALATTIHDMPPCCSERGIVAVLKDYMVGPSDLLQGGRLHSVVDALTLSKTGNVAAECSFARAASMAQACRSKRHKSGTLSCKHVLAEAKSLHRRHISQALSKEGHRGARNFAAVPTGVLTGGRSDQLLLPSAGKHQNKEAMELHALLDADMGYPLVANPITSSLAEVEQAIQTQRCCSGRQRKEHLPRLNGWLAFQHDILRTGVALPGEHREERRKRLWAEAFCLGVCMCLKEFDVCWSWCCMTSRHKTKPTNQQLLINKGHDAVVSALPC